MCRRLLRVRLFNLLLIDEARSYYTSTYRLLVCDVAEYADVTY